LFDILPLGYGSKKPKSCGSNESGSLALFLRMKFPDIITIHHNTRAELFRALYFGSLRMKIKHKNISINIR